MFLQVRDWSDGKQNSLVGMKELHLQYYINIKNFLIKTATRLVKQAQVNYIVFAWITLVSIGK